MGADTPPATDQQGVLDEENGGVVSSQVPVALLGVELDSKASRVSHRVCRPRLSSCKMPQQLTRNLEKVTSTSARVALQTESADISCRS